MDVSQFMEYLNTYGILIIFIIIFLEHLNAPGIPAGVIMPLIGGWTYKNDESIIIVLLVSVIAGTIGSSVLYYIGYLGGDVLIEKINKKFPKYKDKISKNRKMIQEKGKKGVYISKLIPVIRNISPLPAGVAKIDFYTFFISSTLGILTWNAVFIGMGYFFYDIVIERIIP